MPKIRKARAVPADRLILRMVCMICSPFSGSQQCLDCHYMARHVFQRHRTHQRVHCLLVRCDVVVQPASYQASVIVYCRTLPRPKRIQVSSPQAAQRKFICMACCRVPLVYVSKTTQVALEMRDQVIAVSSDPKPPFISLLYPHKPVLVLRFVHEEKDQGSRPVTGSTPHLPTCSEGPA